MLLTVNISGQYSECIYTESVFRGTRDVLVFLDSFPESMSARVRISNNRDCGEAVDYLVQENPFSVPDGYFASGDNVYLQFETPETHQLVVIPVTGAAAPNTPVPPIPIPEGGDIYHHYDEDRESMVIGDGNIDSESEGG